MKVVTQLRKLGVCQGFFREASSGILGTSTFGFSVGQSRKYSTEREPQPEPVPESDTLDTSSQSRKYSAEPKPESDSPDTQKYSITSLIQKTESPVRLIPTDKVIFMSADALVSSECGIGILARDLESGKMYFWKSFYKVSFKEVSKYDTVYHALESIEDALKCCLENGLASNSIILMNDNENAVDFTMMASVPELYTGVCRRINLLKLQFEKPVKIIHKIPRLINSVKYLSKYEPLKEKKRMQNIKQAIKDERKRFPVTSEELSIYGQCRK